MDYCRKVSPLEYCGNRDSLLRKLVRISVCVCLCTDVHVYVGRWVVMCVGEGEGGGFGCVSRGWMLSICTWEPTLMAQ